MDFTFKTYHRLIIALQRAGYAFIPFEAYCKGDTSALEGGRFVVLRHDVDLLPQQSLRFARLESQMGIAGTYYFRAVPESWEAAVMTEIAALGHEVGYHYENLTTHGGDVAKGIADFETNLTALRQLVDVKTICMHGSPRSPYDSKDLWKTHRYQDYGILGEPYFDVDFDNVFYLTDTGRRWDGWKVSVRDKVPQQERWVEEGLVFHSTQDIINSLTNRSLSGEVAERSRSADLPDRIMMTFHPQRWHSSVLPWLKALVLQKAKDVVKRVFILIMNYL